MEFFAQYLTRRREQPRGAFGSASAAAASSADHLSDYSSQSGSKSDNEENMDSYDTGISMDLMFLYRPSGAVSKRSRAHKKRPISDVIEVEDEYHRFADYIDDDTVESALVDEPLEHRSRGAKKQRRHRTSSADYPRRSRSESHLDDYDIDVQPYLELLEESDIRFIDEGVDKTAEEAHRERRQSSLADASHVRTTPMLRESPFNDSLLSYKSPFSVSSGERNTLAASASSSTAASSPPVHLASIHHLGFEKEREYRTYEDDFDFHTFQVRDSQSSLFSSSTGITSSSYGTLLGTNTSPMLRLPRPPSPPPRHVIEYRLHIVAYHGRSSAAAAAAAATASAANVSNDMIDETEENDGDDDEYAYLLAKYESLKRKALRALRDVDRLRNERNEARRAVEILYRKLAKFEQQHR